MSKYQVIVEFRALYPDAKKPEYRLVLERDAARAELARLTTPRPIAEAPRDGGE